MRDTENVGKIALRAPTTTGRVISNALIRIHFGAVAAGNSANLHDSEHLRGKQEGLEAAAAILREEYTRLIKPEPAKKEENTSDD